MEGIQKVAIVGAGAIGAVIASLIEEQVPGSVCLVAGGERLGRLEREGLRVNGRTWHLPLCEAGVTAELADLIIVAVKHHQLPQAIADMAGLVGEQSLILSLLNGIESEESIAAVYGSDKVLYSMIVQIDAVREGGEVRYARAGTINFGEAHNGGIVSPRVARIAEFFGRAGIDYQIPPDMIRSLWFKLMINVGVNQISALLRSPYGFLQHNPQSKALIHTAMREVIALSRNLGTGLGEGDLETWDRILLTLHPEAKTSMLQDIEAGRKTEVEIFAGTVVALAAKAGIAVPVNTFILDLIHALEAGASENEGFLADSQEYRLCD